MADRMYEHKHKDQPFHRIANGKAVDWQKAYGPKAPIHFRDGVRVWVSPYDLTPEDDFI